MNDLYKEENELYLKGYKYIAGCDEAGRGPMAGPLVASAVILPVGCHIAGVNDSKKLSSKKRDELYNIIFKEAVQVEVEVISVEEVDKINVYSASKKAMIECLKRMNSLDYVLSDAMPMQLNVPCKDIIKGDAKSASIACASIIAKVTRDRIMLELDKKYPEYGFKYHKGYVTKMHKEALKKYGVTEVHRKTFAPVKEAMVEQLKFPL